MIREPLPELTAARATIALGSTIVVKRRPTPAPRSPPIAGYRIIDGRTRPGSSSRECVLGGVPS